VRILSRRASGCLVRPTVTNITALTFCLEHPSHPGKVVVPGALSSLGTGPGPLGALSARSQRPLSLNPCLPLFFLFR
jgi:hypothetical protein